MTNVLEYGFDKFSDEITQRATALVDSLNNDQRKALRKLAAHKDAYYDDAKRFMVMVIEMELSNKDVSVGQRKINIKLEATHVLLRAITQFTLALGEIVQFGDVQGDLPHFESERIIDI